MIYCIYHNSDYDGECSAAIINYKMKDKQCPVEFIGMNYGDEFILWDKVNWNDTVFMVDFSLPLNDMISLNKITDFIWIDHHKAIIEEYNELFSNNNYTTIGEYNHLGSLNYFDIRGIREIGKGACELTWNFLFPNKKLPRSIKLLSNFDVWKHTKDVIPFQYGLSLYDTSVPNKDLWFKLFDFNDNTNMFINEIIETGKLLYKRGRSVDEKYMKLYSFETTFEGYNVIAVNRKCTSLSFESVFDKDKHQIMMPFFYNPDSKKWIHSLYADSEDIDVSKIAKKYGGGGHKNAAGFENDNSVLTIR